VRFDDTLDRLPAVVLLENPARFDAPIQIAVHQEPARRNEEINVLEVGLDELLAQVEVSWRDVREAAVTATWRCFETQLIVNGAHHLTMTVADRQVLVQRVQDCCVRKRAPCRADRGVAPKKGMLEMHDVRFEGEQQVAVVLGQRGHSGCGAEEPVVVGGVDLEQKLIWVVANECGKRPLMGQRRRVRRPDTGKHHGLELL
jgi:hypothetical protein